MLAKCVNEEQENWAIQLPYVIMAYRSSVHESTGYSPQFLVQRRLHRYHVSEPGTTVYHRGRFRIQQPESFL